LEQAPQQDSPGATDGGDGLVSGRFQARADLAVALLLACTGFLFAIFMPYFIGSGGIETAQDFMTISPAFFPRLVMGLLCVVCLPYVAEALRELSKSTGRHTAEDFERLKRAGIMVAIAICYAASITWLGFILSTMIVSAVSSYFLGLRKPVLFVPGVLVTPIVIRFVFERLLYISLPRSEIETVAVVEDAVIGLLVRILL